jgi:S1-C subfamily serine protease
VELDGIMVGTTPYTVEIPSSYVKGGRSVFTKFLRHQIHLRLTLSGYLPKEVDLANGPTPFVTLNGVNHGDIWILKSDNFHFAMEKAATTFTGNVQVNLSNAGASTMTPSITTEELVHVAGPAVLLVQTAEGTGSGFLVESSGIAVTNAHVAKGQNQLTVIFGNEQRFEAKVVYVDTALDVALLKLVGDAEFPRLKLADLGSIQAGSSVVAIGSPSTGFQNSVTKGIVGGIGPIPGEPGTWIQTDAAINPGNSGGPLLNSSGEVIGITTQKHFASNDGRPLQGIGFALSSNDLLSVLSRFYPNLTVEATPLKPAPHGKGKVSISADLDGADIFIDAKFVGNAPAVFSLSSGPHRIEVRGLGGAVWSRNLEVLEDSEVSLRALLRR